ncbi:hypothetical protein KIL84_001953 [Mauremys mutica]|uniref:Cyclin C-terminal domain-containing protein n=1 Tax=Mauremys mutica TaxID=74926 RepID=A0A9D4B5E1_9SAUR|nr:hypothetical protein KIL84_001953 [Mauremys mutica]
MMCAALGPAPQYHELRAWAPQQRPVSQQLQAEEKRELLKSKNKGPGGDKGARTKKPQGSRVREAAPEKAAAVCPGIPATPVLQRGGPPGGPQALLCLPEALAEELSQALVALGMALEQDYAWDIFTSMMRKQSSYVFRSWEVPRALTAEMRALIVDWLVQVHEYLGLADETLYLAVYLMNAYMKVARVRLCLMEADCAAFEPAQLAAAALGLAQRVQQEAGAGGSGAGPEGSTQLCLYSEEALGAVHRPMARAALRAGGSTLQAVFLKYSRPQKLGASTSPAIAGSDYLARCRSPAP